MMAFGPGVLSGAPWRLENQGAPVCEVAQHFRTASLVLSPRLLEQWGLGCGQLHVSISSGAVEVRGGNSQPLMLCRLWKPVLPEQGSWRALGEGGGLGIQLTKHPDHLGSWPYVFEEVALLCPPVSAAGPGGAPGAGGASQPTGAATGGPDLGSAAAGGGASGVGGAAGALGRGAPSMDTSGDGGRAPQQEAPASDCKAWEQAAVGELRVVWCQSRRGFEEEALRCARRWKEEQERRAVLAAESKAAAQQASERLGREPPLQVAFLLPSDPGQCLHLVVSCITLPPVAKLLRLSQQVLDLEDVLSGAASPDSPPPHALPMLRFVAGLATIEQLRARHGVAAVQAAQACGGCGCGSEYAALVFGGVLGLPDALGLLAVHTAALKERASMRGPTAPKYSGAAAGGEQPTTDPSCTTAGGTADAPTTGSAGVAGTPATPTACAPTAPDVPAGDATVKITVRPAPAARLAAQVLSAKLAADVAGAVAGSLEGVRLRGPRIQVYCSLTGRPYHSLAAVREWLPAAAAQAGGEARVLEAWERLGAAEIWRLHGSEPQQGQQL